MAEKCVLNETKWKNKQKKNKKTDLNNEIVVEFVGFLRFPLYGIVIHSWNKKTKKIHLIWSEIYFVS